MYIAKNKNRDSLTRRNLIEELRRESEGVIGLAYMYAKGFEKLGIDITWESVEERIRVLQEVYNKGYEDGFVKGVQDHNEDNRRA